MVQTTGDTTAITQMGSSIKNLGYAQIVIMVVAVFIGMIMGGSIVAIAAQSGSLEEFILDFADTLRVFMIILLLLSLVGIYFYYQLYQSFKFIETDSEFASSSMDRAVKLFGGIIILQIIGFFMGFYFINLIINDLEELATNDPTVEEFEKFANELSTSAEVIGSSIMGIVVSSLMLGAFKSIQDWTGELHHSTKIYWFAEAGKKLGNIRIGVMILLAGQVFNLITLGAFGDFFEFIGLIVLIVYYIKVGNILENLPRNINDQTVTTQYTSYEIAPQPEKQELANTQASPTEIYCTNCGYSNHGGSRFCNSCGSKLT
ncbi:MAG: hypothetical protein GPJ54_22015 [Candidatus Heimdallarchaeota archaeon]|nr:hypothetical protein [Candidatus Heimdallarchaeota archaeon]